MTLLKTQKGFTIIELLIVIAIIGILTAIITANLAQSKSKSRDAKRISDIAQIQLALELFFDRCNQYPGVSGGMPDIDASCTAGRLDTFISKIPTAPPQGSPYEYGVKSGNADYVLKALLENNNSALIDVIHTNYSTLTPAVDCRADLAYCVQPR